ncbi:integrator complex subunit 14-like isoform X2 [Myxocyprinus asiaticus]|uniref:integrator complex subunit 14-like isoform X2 n=1 Tax=Myxocyprinus asiaticus TaxID=70543 RepID=UPI002223E2DB|nr:integrator complex subunit 14-like isoform X2 [Myxocyprinus asiaticus]
MPTVVLMDSSLSMTRPVSVEGSEEFQRKNLAVHGLTMLFEHMATNYRLEFTALVAFSSLWELLVPFTRDYNTLQEALNNLEDYDKTFLESALQGVSNIVQQEWGTSCPCQLQATDGMDNLEQLISINGGEGQIYTMEGPLCLKNVQSMFGKLIDHAYSPFHAVLRCGNLASDVQVFPRPEPVLSDEEVDPMPKTVQPDLEIVGFIEIGDISSPPVLSRHLVLPIAVTKEGDEIGTGATDETEEETATNQMAGKSPNFCVLLHGSLKVEGMVTLVQLGPEWFGMLYSQADSKKKSNLMMSLFEPGLDPLPWLGRLSQLGPASDAAENPYGEGDGKSPFPIQPKHKRSYAQNVTVWIKASGLQTDVQKILRNARKLPEKTQTFYKELNRLRKAALAFGFWELLKSVAELLERECTLLPDSAHPDAAFQLSHAAQQLKLASSGDSKYAAFEHNITPMLTDFSGGGGAERM